jgi:tetratricopeptide (TPR) repeat protein
MGSILGCAKSLWQRATEVGPSLLKSKLRIILLLVPSVGSSQVNHLEIAARFLNQGQLEQAESEAREGLKNPTTQPVALAMLGTIRLQEGKYHESTNFLTQALKLNPQLVGARINLGQAYLLQGNPKQAQASFQEALKRDPSNFNARFDLAKLESSLLNFQGSLDVAKPIVSQLYETEEGILLLASNYGALGKKDQLTLLFGKWQQLAAPSAESSLDFGSLLATYEMGSQANEIFEAEDAKITAHPSASLAFKLGKGYLPLGDLDKAQKNLQLALALHPDCATCNLYLAQIAEKQGITEKALAYMIEAKKREPENPEILFEFGKVCLQQNLVKDALPALDKAVSLQPSRDSYVYVLASANVAGGDLTKAASLLTSLLQKHPGDAVLNYAMGAVYYLQGKYAEAESSLKRSLQAQPDQVAASYYLGLTYDAIGDDDQAVPTFRGLLKGHPDHAPAYLKLGGILLREHQYDEARQDLERAISLQPDSPEAHYQLGVLLRRLGRTAESEEQFAQSRKLDTEQHSHMRLQLLVPD